MKDLHKLIEQRKKVDDFLTKAKEIKEATIDNLIVTRKEIADLQHLMPNYPDSVDIAKRLQQCDDALEIGRQVLMSIEAQLPQYEQQVKDLDDLMEKLDAATQQTQSSLRRSS